MKCGLRFPPLYPTLYNYYTTPIIYGCLLRVLYPVRWRVMTVDYLL